MDFMVSGGSRGGGGWVGARRAKGALCLPNLLYSHFYTSSHALTCFSVHQCLKASKIFLDPPIMGVP